MLNFFNNITPIYLIFLLYGATFLFLGVSIAAKNMKGSDLQLADSLWLLSMFGLLHGAHEWMELGPLIEGEHLTFEQIFSIEAISTLLVFLSFLSLLLFGISLIRGSGDKRMRWANAVPVPVFIVWALHIWYFGFHEEGFHIDMQSLRQANIGARYTFGFVGGMMAGYGLIVNSREVSALSMSVAKKLYYAGIAFGFYAVFAGIFSFSYELPLIPVPVVVLRGITGISIAYFIIKALNIFDIETRKKIERQTRRLVQTEKLTSLGQLAAGIAHEMNNPLTNASLGIQMLRNKVKSAGSEPEIVKRLDAVERNIDKASSIARELLQFSRQKESEFITCNINQVINGALTLVHHKLGNVAVRQAPGTVPDVMCDPVKLEQVFINIISNAVEAMPAGGEIAIATSQKNGKVYVEISDTGVGIPDDHLPRVFDPFFTTKELGKGTGLGLSICYGIVKQHYGAIEVRSKVGIGTTVTIKIPTREQYEKVADRG